MHRKAYICSLLYSLLKLVSSSKEPNQLMHLFSIQEPLLSFPNMAATSQPSLAHLHGLRRTQALLGPLQAITSPNTELRLQSNPIGAPATVKRKMSSRRTCIVGSTTKPSDSNLNSHSMPASSSLASMIRRFYDRINDKNHSDNELDRFISHDCFFEDLAFTKPFKGREEVHNFLRELRQAMGKHIIFAIERVFEGEHLTVGVLWHLEWNQEIIPFTKGCSLFECSRNGEEILIEKARIFEESPVKPGDIVLELLKIISSLFDKFPNMAERFLQKPHAVLQFVMKIYKTFLEPMVFPLLVYYTHIWTYAARLLSYVLNLVLSLVRIFM